MGTSQVHRSLKSLSTEDASGHAAGNCMQLVYIWIELTMETGAGTSEGLLLT